MSLVKVAVAVYNVSKITDLEGDSRLPLSLIQNEKLEATFKDYVIKTRLPERLQKKVISLIRTINVETEKWKWRHFKILDWNVDVRKFLVWKLEGTIDRYRTAVRLIKNDILSISKKFLLACCYCLSEYAESLWVSMSELQRKQVLDEDEPYPSVVKYYIDKFQGENIELRVEYCRTVAALNYFLAQSTSEQRILSLLIAVRLNSRDNHILRFCLSQMKGDELAKVFEHYPLDVLSCFIEWPLLPFFLDIANQLWTYLPAYHFFLFLEFLMSERIVPGWKDFDYEGLLVQFWLQSPSSFKEYVKQDRTFDINLLTSILSRNRVQLT
ncbi:hypothetical protein HNY73_008063 [Argiope bruennichi]|uniref:Uncharacterized protein n=1 Tax=Argiope bruennichi TaxID=94029 RepID=A0A8T0F547_ARGBR|nr:hypothetical protein HNY73_008063 [Argiope bruennichi]